MRFPLLLVHIGALTSFACAGSSPPPSPPPASSATPPSSAQVQAAPAESAGDPFAYDATLPLAIEKGEIRSGHPSSVQSLSYASPRGGRVPALFVLPGGGTKHPVVIFQHKGAGDKSQFLDEAEELAKLGIASLLLEGPWLRPEHRGKTLRTHWTEMTKHGAVDVLRAIDVVSVLPNLDPERIAFVGHSYGANLGAIVASRSARVKAMVLMAGVPNYGRLVKDADAEPLGAEHFIEKSQAAVFEQFAIHDETIPNKEADDYFDKTPAPKVKRIYEADHAMKSDVARQDRREFLEHVFALQSGTPAFELSKIPGYFMARLPVAYPLPPATAFERLPEQTYRSVSGRDYQLDVYRPTGKATPRPVVMFIHGQTHPALLRDAKGWRGYRELAEILAARGYVAVVPNLGATATGYERKNLFSNIVPVADNLDQAVHYVRTNAARLGVDPKRMALWVASAGGAYGLGSALGNATKGVRAVVAYYPLITESALTETEPRLSEATLDRLSPTRQLRRRAATMPPVLVVRAGYDWDVLNRGIDDFVKLGAERKAPVTLLSYENAHHGFEILDATDETRVVLDKSFAFLDAKLRE